MIVVGNQTSLTVVQKRVNFLQFFLKEGKESV